MNSFVILHAKIVTPDGTLPNASLRVEDGIITQIGEEIREEEELLPVIDARGAILMPGIIDIHTDALDMEIVPRPGADIPIVIAFRELERKMSGCGFTTVFHSLHLGYEVAEGQQRSKYTRREIFETIHQAAAGPTLLNNKIHLRYELTGVHAYEDCLEFIKKGYVSLLSVMDHTPGQGQFGKDNFKRHMLAQGKTEAQIAEEMNILISRPRIEGERLKAMIRLAKDHHIPVASHDDDTVEKVDFMHDLGVDICEFPITLETARHATKRGMQVAGGASNILRGGSLSGNLTIKDAVKEGAVDTLCSDYYPPSILYSVFKLHQDEKMPLSEVVKLATLNPARAAGIHSYTGSIETGKNADLLLVKMQGGYPMITHTIVGGHIVSQARLSTGGNEIQAKKSNEEYA